MFHKLAQVLGVAQLTAEKDTCYMAVRYPFGPSNPRRVPWPPVITIAGTDPDLIAASPNLRQLATNDASTLSLASAASGEISGECFYGCPRVSRFVDGRDPAKVQDFERLEE